MQVDFVVAFLAVTYARAIAAPLNAAYKEVSPGGIRGMGVKLPELGDA